MGGRVGGRLLTATAALLVGGLLVGGLPATAAADTWSGRDSAHDVKAAAYSSQPEPCGTVTELDGSHNRTADLLRLSVDHRSSEVVLSARLRGYRPAAHASTTFHLRTPTGRFQVSVFLQRGRRAPGTFFSREPHIPKPTGPCHDSFVTIGEKPCVGLTARVTPTTNTYSVTIPRACIGRPDWVQVGVEVFSSCGSASYDDQWGHGRGHGQLRFVPPYGPRVASGSHPANGSPS